MVIVHSYFTLIIGHCTLIFHFHYWLLYTRISLLLSVITLVFHSHYWSLYTRISLSLLVIVHSYFTLIIGHCTLIFNFHYWLLYTRISLLLLVIALLLLKLIFKFISNKLMLWRTELYSWFPHMSYNCLILRYLNLYLPISLLIRVFRYE